MTRATDTEQRASEWIIRSEAGNFTEEMRVERDRWLENPRHRVTYIRIQEAWRRASRLRGAHPLDGNVDPDLLKDSNPRPVPQDNRSRTRWPLRIGAAAILSLIIYLTGLLWSVLGSPDWTAYTTSIGGYESVTLSDGTDIQLNTDTELRARITGEKREIRLVQGEALIKVARDGHRPFTVRTGDTSLKADRSSNDRPAFSIRLHASGAVDVAVTGGKVLLSPSVRVIDVALGRDPPDQSTVQAGELAHVRPEGIQLTKVGLEEINRKLSWTAGLLSFQGETLTEVTDEFNRYNRKHLVVVDPLIADRRIGGAFQAVDPESFVSALQKWFGVRAEEQPLAGSDNSIIRLSSSN